MTIKDKMKTYNFWISLVSAILLIVRVVGDKYGFSVDSGLVMDITTGVCGIFVILGIISVPQKAIDKLQNNNKNSEVHVGMEKENEYNEVTQNTSDKVIGRFQNVLIEMAKKVQNETNNNENANQNKQNINEIHKFLTEVTMAEDDKNSIESNVESIENEEIDCADNECEIHDDLAQSNIEKEVELVDENVIEIECEEAVVNVEAEKEDCNNNLTKDELVMNDETIIVESDPFDEMVKLFASFDENTKRKILDSLSNS